MSPTFDLPDANPRPASVEACLARADRALLAGRREDAKSALGDALALEPDHPAAHARRTALCIQETDWKGLREEMEWNHTRMPPDHAAYDRSYLSLLFGEMPVGWDQYEVRLTIPGKVKPRRDFTQPRWQGEPFPDRTLLLHFEQGFGDTIMFVRYAARVKALGGRVILAAQRELADVLATCPGLDEVVPDGDPLPPFDFHLPLPSLPQVFRTDLASIPCQIPYLDIPREVPNRQMITELLALSEGKTRIGYAWAGHPGHKRDADRSMPRAALGMFAGLPDVAWYSFQMGVRQEAPLPDLTPLAPALSNFSDTAYALSGMDLVITVDTALAHLAGALGIPTLLLLHFQPDFRWMLNREDSPWYPSLRIYRQPQPGDWAGALRKLLQDLG